MDSIAKLSSELSTVMTGEKRIKISKDKSDNCGIYFLYYGDDLVYIGQTTNIELRIRSHAKSEKVFDSYSFRSFPKEQLNLIEALLILEKKPIYNNAVPKTELFISKGELNIAHRITKSEIKRLHKDGDLTSIYSFKNFILMLRSEVLPLIESGRILVKRNNNFGKGILTKKYKLEPPHDYFEDGQLVRWGE